MSRSLIQRALREADGDQAARFIRAQRDARDRITRFTDQKARALERLSKEFRQEIKDRLAAFTGRPEDPFTTRIIPQVGQQVQQALNDLQAGLGAEIREVMADAFENGGSALVKALRAVNVPGTFPTVSPQLLQALTGTFENVLDELISSLGDRIMAQVRLGAAALQPASGTIRTIVQQLRTSREVRAGLRKRIGFAFQAEAIARTEIGRAYSVAQHSTGLELADQIPGLKKKWRTVLASRRGHVDAENRYAEGGEIGPIPVRQRFIVTEFSRTGTTSFLTLGKNIRPRGFTAPGQRVVRVNPYTRTGQPITDRMLFPRDPDATPGNVINCTCHVEEVVPELEKAAQRAGGVVS